MRNGVGSGYGIEAPRFDATSLKEHRQRDGVGFATQGAVRHGHAGRRWVPKE